MLAAILGAGRWRTRFFVALRLPNHFRAIFRGRRLQMRRSFPAYAYVHGERGEVSARLFADRIFTSFFLLATGSARPRMVFMPQAMRLLAPGLPTRGATTTRDRS